MSLRNAMPSDANQVEIVVNGPIASDSERMLSFLWNGTAHKVTYHNGQPCIEIGYGTYIVYQEGKTWNIKPVVMEQMPLKFVEA